MRIFAEKLAENLARKLSGIYLVFGNEPLLQLESRDQIYAVAHQAGFEEKYQFVVDSNINWSEVYDCCQAMSLFSSRKVIELEVPESGINASASKELVALYEYLHDDMILLLTGSKLTRQQENTKWFKTLNQYGVWVSCMTPDIQRLPGFIQSRCIKLGLKPDPEALKMLAQWHEGNLLALSQGLEKLSLLYPDGILTLVRIEESLSRHNHFTAFHWIDAVLVGKPNRALRILRQLEAEGVELIILLRTLQKEIQLLLQLKQESQSGTSLGALFDKNRIWQSKRPLYNAALNRLTYKNLTKSYKLLTKLEIQTKTQYENSGWLDINHLSLELCSPDNLIPLTEGKG